MGDVAPFFGTGPNGVTPPPRPKADVIPPRGPAAVAGGAAASVAASPARAVNTARRLSFEGSSFKQASTGTPRLWLFEMHVGVKACKDGKQRAAASAIKRRHAIF
jgi:hypothetical protein